MKILELRLEFNETLPKMNDAPSDCQDALSVNSETGRYAVADGVTRSFFPAEWSKLLVEQFCHDTSKPNLDLFKTKNWQDWLSPIQDKWSALIHEKVSKKTGIDSIHLKNSIIARDPAASTFVGLQVDTYSTNPSWRAMIIGDSCLFYFKNNGELNSYLVKNSSDFNYHPQYFSSIPSSRKDEPSFLNGNLEVGDIFVLTTDALAKWLFIQKEKNSANWNKTLQTLMSLKSRQELFAFVSNARNNKEFPMEDDDVALIILSCVRADETFEKPIPKTPVFVQEQRQPAIAVTPPPTKIPPYTPPAPVKPTRSETVRSRKDENTSKQASSSKSALPTLAIIVSLISLLVSLYTLWLFGEYKKNAAIPTVQVMPAPTRFQPTTPPTVEIIPTPTNFQPIISTLPANILVYLEQDSQSKVVLTTQSNTSVLILEQSNGWYKVVIELWLFSNNTESDGFLVQDNLIMTQAAIPAYSAVSITPVAVGTFSPSVILQKTNESTDISGTWYQVKFQGYVLGR